MIYSVAELTEEQYEQIKELEHEIGVVLIAYEPDKAEGIAIQNIEE
ncbi:hypothetical protein [Salsuginibacillus kocurii]|nr:hypothetical protein [Salsuginibacillus kocurii]